MNEGTWKSVCGRISRKKVENNGKKKIENEKTNVAKPDASHIHKYTQGCPPGSA